MVNRDSPLWLREGGLKALCHRVGIIQSLGFGSCDSAQTILSPLPSGGDRDTVGRRSRFRAAIMDALQGEEGSLLRHAVTMLARDHLLILRSFATDAEFRSFVDAYEEQMANGSDHTRLGHRFLDLSKHPTLLRSTAVQNVYLHPYLVALVAHQLGGPVRLVDARCKDTGPMRSVMRDNGVHFDDTLYGAECKILLLWEKATMRGPRSQNFVAIAGASGLRRRTATEHGSNFKTPQAIIDEILCNPSLTKGRPVVVEAADAEPLTVIFEGTAVPHHRFRTLAHRQVRSTLQLAFHVDDSDDSRVDRYDVGSQQSNLWAFVVGGAIDNGSPEAKEEFFLEAIAQASRDIASKARKLSVGAASVPIADKEMSRDSIVNWLFEIGTTPTLADVRPRASRDAIRDESDVRDFLLLAEYDKHYDMDLRLYPDRREVVRLRARNRIREMSIECYSKLMGIGIRAPALITIQ